MKGEPTSNHPQRPYKTRTASATRKTLALGVSGIGRGPIGTATCSKQRPEFAQARTAPRFLFDAPDYLGTRDEESSGIIDASDPRLGWFLLTIQAPHSSYDPLDQLELVAGAQLLARHVPPGR